MKKPVLWNGYLVGYWEFISADNFFLWGKWEPVTSPETSEFLKEIETTGDCKVSVDGMFASVGGVPENGVLEIKIIFQ